MGYSDIDVGIAAQTQRAELLSIHRLAWDVELGGWSTAVEATIHDGSNTKRGHQIRTGFPVPWRYSGVESWRKAVPTKDFVCLTLKARDWFVQAPPYS
jgi:hypothetical protein